MTEKVNQNVPKTEEMSNQNNNIKTKSDNEMLF